MGSSVQPEAFTARGAGSREIAFPRRTQSQRKAINCSPMPRQPTPATRKGWGNLHLLLGSVGLNVQAVGVFTAQNQGALCEAHGLGTRTYHGTLQRTLVARRAVVQPLRPVRMDVSQVQLLHQAAAALLRPRQGLVVRLHPQQAQLVHGEAQSRGAVTLGFGAQQFVERSGAPGAARGQETAAALVRASVDAGGRLPHGLLAVENDAHLVQVVVGLGGPAGDPRGLAQPQLAFDDQRVGGLAAGRVPVVELEGLEEAVGVEKVGAGEELRPRPHLTPGDRGSAERRYGNGRLVGSGAEAGERGAEGREGQISRSSLRAAAKRDGGGHRVRRDVLCPPGKRDGGAVEPALPRGQ